MPKHDGLEYAAAVTDKRLGPPIKDRAESSKIISNAHATGQASRVTAADAKQLSETKDYPTEDSRAGLILHDRTPASRASVGSKRRHHNYGDGGGSERIPTNCRSYCRARRRWSAGCDNCDRWNWFFYFCKRTTENVHYRNQWTRAFSNAFRLDRRSRGSDENSSFCDIAVADRYIKRNW